MLPLSKNLGIVNLVKMDQLDQLIVQQAVPPDDAQALGGKAVGNRLFQV